MRTPFKFVDAVCLFLSSVVMLALVVAGAAFASGAPPSPSENNPKFEKKKAEAKATTPGKVAAKPSKPTGKPFSAHLHKSGNEMPYATAAVRFTVGGTDHVMAIYKDTADPSTAKWKGASELVRGTCDGFNQRDGQHLVKLKCCPGVPGSRADGFSFAAAESVECHTGGS